MLEMNVYIEDPNVMCGMNALPEIFEGYKIDYNALRKYLKKKFQLDVIRAAIYTPKYKNNSNSQSNFLTFLKDHGFQIFTKELIPIISLKNGFIKNKCNFDVEITSDIHDLMESRPNPQNQYITIVSGDIDFLYLIKKIKNRGFIPVVISFASITRNTLKNITEYISFEELFENRKENNIFVSSADISERAKRIDSRWEKLNALK